MRREDLKIGILTDKFDDYKYGKLEASRQSFLNEIDNHFRINGKVDKNTFTKLVDKHLSTTPYYTIAMNFINNNE